MVSYGIPFPSAQPGSSRNYAICLDNTFRTKKEKYLHQLHMMKKHNTSLSHMNASLSNRVLFLENQERILSAQVENLKQQLEEAKTKMNTGKVHVDELLEEQTEEEGSVVQEKEEEGEIDEVLSDAHIRA